MFKSYHRALIVGILSLILPLSFSLSVFAQDARTPYGDYQQWCGAYGVCRNDMGPEESERTIKGYFSSKGLRVGRIQHRGRFIEAEVYKNNKMIDRIIFDRKTGRIRSVY